MKHVIKQKVFYCDTDAYGVVWHGSYLRWLEMGRVSYCEDAGVYLKDLEENDIVLPVAEMKVKYIQPAKLSDVLKISTEISDYSKVSMTFSQSIYHETLENKYIEATFKVVAIHTDGKLYRSLPGQVLKIVR